MNLVLVFEEDFVGPSRVVLTGRRARHVRDIHRAVPGQVLGAGLAGGGIGKGRVLRSGDRIEMELSLTDAPPPPLDVTLVLALPRPKVLNRVVAAVSSLGVKRIFLINSWRVEKSYWHSPRVSEENLTMQAVLGLEQAGDTILPRIELRRLFRPFVEDELPSLAGGTTALVAHPAAEAPCPCGPSVPLTLAIGPEGGFIDQEIDSLTRAGFRAVSLGRRILRVETVTAALLSRLT